MNDALTIVDQEVRVRVLDPTRSFIVQAPAGSGKTGLLIQRYLTLLAGVQTPEEIVAITFTRKAAGEMRQRILEALADACANRAPLHAHQELTLDLARRAVRRDREMNWRLLENPVRLRIQTIDSLCLTLVRQMPILSRFGASPAIAEDPAELYLEAAANVIADLESGANWSEDIAHLVSHLDNRLDQLQSLIAGMLARRDQWLRHLADPAHPALTRERLEAGLADLVAAGLAAIARCCPREIGAELLELLRYAAENLAGSDSPIRNCAGLDTLPDTTLADRPVWEELRQFLLTKDGAWRARITKNEGFPAAGDFKDPTRKARSKEMKERMSALLDALSGNESLRNALADLDTLPPARYTEAEWRTLQALIGLLRIAAAHLEVVFQTRGQVDYAAVTQAALAALGEPESPTDLALAMDYRVRHLLVDEFQDTSWNQFELIRRLTAGWQPGEDHSLFAVGDPMQSIYRFREAEVGLFLDACLNGIGQIRLEFLRLSVNFRAQQGLVDWINASFPEVLGRVDDIGSGAVAAAPAEAFHPALDGPAVTIIPQLERSDRAEADQVVGIIQRLRAEEPAGTTAVLVRSRAHLALIAPVLQVAGLRYQAVEIEKLGGQTVVLDLLAITRALLHPADRIAWLALLRAPFCGLTLMDLHTLAGGRDERAIHDLLHDTAVTAGLSPDGQNRLRRVLPILDAAMAGRDRCTLRQWTEGVWIALGGPACLPDRNSGEDAEVFLRLLEDLGQGDLHRLEHELNELYALPDAAADGTLQLMTLHKAKGLEFDHVIMPGLGRSPRRAEERLLSWLEHNREGGQSDLLLAPVSAAGEDTNRIAAYLRRLEQTHSRHENSRLVYVGATRARRRLYLLGHVPVKDSADGPSLSTPREDTLLARLWPVAEPEFAALLAKPRPQPGTEQAPDRTPPSARKRLIAEWTAPEPPLGISKMESVFPERIEASVEFDWAGEDARIVGTVLHRLLHALAQRQARAIDDALRERLELTASGMLEARGMIGDRLRGALASVQAALQTILADARGRWILDHEHQEAVAEFALSGVVEGRLDHIVVDRSFIDNDGVRWIIDYKLGSHGGSDREGFLDREQQRYRAQLERYARIYSVMDARPIRLGLYFPLLAGWREWSYSLK